MVLLSAVYRAPDELDQRAGLLAGWVDGRRNSPAMGPKDCGSALAVPIPPRGSWRPRACVLAGVGLSEARTRCTRDRKRLLVRGGPQLLKQLALAIDCHHSKQQGRQAPSLRVSELHPDGGLLMVSRSRKQLPYETLENMTGDDIVMYTLGWW